MTEHVKLFARVLSRFVNNLSWIRRLSTASWTPMPPEVYKHQELEFEPGLRVITLPLKRVSRWLLRHHDGAPTRTAGRIKLDL